MLNGLVALAMASAVAAAVVVTTQFEAAFDLTSVRFALLCVRLKVSIELAFLILVSR